MKLKPFELERYFSKHEFSASHLLSCSDCEPLNLSDLIDNADNESKEMFNNLTLSYTHSQGHPVLLEEISKLYRGITADNIIEMIPEEGIYIAMRSLVNVGDHVITMYPCYQSLEEVAVSQGAKVDRWTAEYNDGWIFDIDKLESLCTQDTHMIVLNTPHNPTGILFSKDDFNRIIEICRKNNCILFCDEMYRFLEFDESLRLPSACEAYENAISLCGLSKSFALPGLRCGWLITKNPNFINKFKTYKDYTTICASATSEILGIMALRQKDAIIKRNLDIIFKNLEHLDLFSKKYKDIIEYKRPNAGSICMPVLHDSIDADKLALELIESESLMILPASVYNFDFNGFRLGFGRNDFIENLNIMDTYLQSKYNKIKRGNK